ncbi:MAG TPA: hypothetical protein VMG12_24250 [Polyangiaceae bacterium]|nr:hypothetical protein [Polyangiaceae bacterium]
MQHSQRHRLGVAFVMGLAALAGCGGLAADGPSHGGLGLPGGAEGEGLDPDRVVAPGEQASGTSLLDRTLSAMAEDLQGIDAEQRRFMRYVTVSHVRNGFDPRDDRASTGASNVGGAREVRQQAIVKLVNSTSTNPTVSRPMVVGREPLYQRIDLRDYGWDRPLRVENRGFRDGWEAIVWYAQQAVAFEGPAAALLREQSRSDVPWLMADDFVATVSSGEVYYELLRLPPTLNGLQASLTAATGIELYRAGLRASLLSYNPRVVERYGSAKSGFWQALDFVDPARGSEIFSDPLSIAADGTEVIFTLPNGLRGYYVADGAGMRSPVSALPTSVITDPAQADGVMRNAASCFSCHNAGLIPFRDQVRDALSSLPPELSAAADELFPEPSVLDGLAASDDDRYFRQLSATGLPVGIEDPISRVYWGYWEDVGPQQAAGELFVEPAVLQRELSRLPASVAALDTASGRVARTAFDEAYFESLCRLHAASENRPSGC